MTLEDALFLVSGEVGRATKKYKPFNSSHEGWGVIHEEADELWDEIKANDIGRARHEAVHLAAMAVRFLMDCHRSNTEDQIARS